MEGPRVTLICFIVICLFHLQRNSVVKWRAGSMNQKEVKKYLTMIVDFGAQCSSFLQ